MRINFVAIAISLIIKYMSVLMLIPVAVAAYYKDLQSILAFSVTTLITLIVGFI